MLHFRADGDNLTEGVTSWAATFCNWRPIRIVDRNSPPHRSGRVDHFHPEDKQAYLHQEILPINNDMLVMRILRSLSSQRKKLKPLINCAAVWLAGDPIFAQKADSSPGSPYPLAFHIDREHRFRQRLQ